MTRVVLRRMLSKEALRGQPRGEEAISEYETALALNRNFVVASRNLTMAGSTTNRLVASKRALSAA